MISKDQIDSANKSFRRYLRKKKNILFFYNKLLYKIPNIQKSKGSRMGGGKGIIMNYFYKSKEFYPLYIKINLCDANFITSKIFNMLIKFFLYKINVKLAIKVFSYINK